MCLYLMLHYGHGRCITTLIMVPINFWQNSDLFKTKVHFSCLKMDKVKSFQRKSLIFPNENISNPNKKSLTHFLDLLWQFWVSYHTTLYLFGSEMPYLGQRQNLCSTLWSNNSTKEPKNNDAKSKSSTLVQIKPTLVQ